MPKLLKAFRGKSARKGKIYKYILYAVGEVTLIVVGILVAVSIGNWNDRRKNEQAIDKIVATIGEDIKEDITQYEYLLARHYRLDSILQRVLNGTLTEQDYQNNWDELHTVITRSIGFYAHKNGYSALQRTIDNVPEDLQPIIGDMTDYYLYHVEGAVFCMDREDRLGWDTIEDWAEKYEWNYSSRRDGNVEPAKLDYLLHSSEYKNKATTYLINTRNTIGLFEWARYNSMRLFLRLSEYRKAPLDSTYKELQKLLSIESPAILASCDSVTTEKSESWGAMKSIVLFRNRSDRPIKISVMSDSDAAPRLFEFPAASLDFDQFVRGEVVKIVDGERDCRGHFKAAVNNQAVE